jgi:hypothetical protein
MRREERSQQLWSLLALAATHRQILTYDIVAKLTGVVRPGIGDFLRPIQQYCSENRLPALTSIVVSDDSGLPGEGFIAAHDVPAATDKLAQDVERSRERIFARIKSKPIPVDGLNSAPGYSPTMFGSCCVSDDYDVRP